jgi:hypothetical protein
MVGRFGIRKEFNMQRTILFAFAGIALAGCVADAPLRCSIPGNCPPHVDDCGTCGPLAWEAVRCAFWAALAVVTPGAFGLLTALQAGEWSAAAEAAGNIASAR